LPKVEFGLVAAKEISLVDEIGGLDAAIQYAAKMLKLGSDWLST